VVLNGEMGVFIFFAISGYLNTQSLLNNPSWWRFLIRRARRVFPALFALALFCVVVGLSVTSADMPTILAKVPAFIVKNTVTLFGIEYNLPGVFTSNTMPAMNGSLWTLPIEIKLYIYLALIALVVRYKSRLLSIAAALIVGYFLIWFNVTTKDTTTAYVSKLTLVFVTGALFAAIERQFSVGIGVIALAMIAVIAAFSVSSIAALPAIALVAILIGRLPSPPWLRPKIDISYGVYLYAFVVQQIVVSYQFPFWISLSLSVAGTISLGIGSAVLVERPAMAWGRKNRAPMRATLPAT
jgi:peptidoglycan/LPS O-acetylase OafA/YrhL